MTEGTSTGGLARGRDSEIHEGDEFVTDLGLYVDPWIAVPDWKTTSVPALTGRASPNCDTASSVISMSLPASPD